MSEFSPDDVAFSDLHNAAAKSKKQPKGILKNSSSSPKKSKSALKQLEEVVEYERPKSARKSKSADGHHHTSKRSSSSKRGDEEKSGKSSKHHHKSHSHEKDRSSSKHHKHTTSSHESSRSKSKREKKEALLEVADLDDIYDRPKVPAIPYIPSDELGHNSLSSKRKTSRKSEEKDEEPPVYRSVSKPLKKKQNPEQDFIESLQLIETQPKALIGGFYENVGFAATASCAQDSRHKEDAFITVGEALSDQQEENEQPLYDVPRSNPRKVSLSTADNPFFDATTSEALYVNEGFSEPTNFPG